MPVELEIPPRSPYVGVVRLAARSLARQADLDEDVAEELRIAVSEACTNAVLAAEESGSELPVRVTWSQDDDRITVLIEDRVSVAEPWEGAPDYDSQGFSTRVMMSQALITSLVDVCEFREHPDGGMTTRLVIGRRRGQR